MNDVLSVSVLEASRPLRIMAANDPFEWCHFEDIHKVSTQVNAFLKHSSHGSILQYPPWHACIADKPERYKVIAALACGLPVFAASVYMSPIPGLRACKASIERGPVFDDERVAIALWDVFEAKLKRWGLCSLEINPFWKREETLELRAYLESRGYTRCRGATCHTETLTVDLKPSEEEIFGSMKGSRNRIRKAISMGIQVRSAQSKEEMQQFWQMFRDMCQLKGLNCSPSRMFENIWRFSMEHPTDCTCLLGWLENTLIGGYIILRHGNVVEITRGGASTTADAQIPKTDLIFWEAIRWAKGIGAAICDLGGITPDAEQGSASWNVNRFKKKFSDHQISIFEPMIKVFNQRLYGLHDVLKRVKRHVTQHLSI